MSSLMGVFSLSWVHLVHGTMYTDLIMSHISFNHRLDSPVPSRLQLLRIYPSSWNLRNPHKTEIFSNLLQPSETLCSLLKHCENLPYLRNTRPPSWRSLELEPPPISPRLLPYFSDSPISSLRVFFFVSYLIRETLRGMNRFVTNEYMQINSCGRVSFA